MKPIETPTTNVVLELPGGTEENNLPAERVRIFPPGAGPADVDVEPADGIQTVWEPTDGERRALANGAPVVLTVWGGAHPPVSMGAGEPVELRALISKDHVDRAAGYFWRLLGEAWLERDEPPAVADVLEFWHQALEATREGGDGGAPASNGNEEPPPAP